jgi:hypothetical protein
MSIYDEIVSKPFNGEIKLVFENVKGLKKSEYNISKIGNIRVSIPIKRMGQDPIVINQSDLENFNHDFCDINPQINEFAKSNSENFFFVMFMAIATIGISWPEFRELYPVLASAIKETNGKLPNVNSIVGLDGEERSVKKWLYKGALKRGIELWNTKDTHYSNIYDGGLINDEFKLYLYILRNVKGASTVKAAFMTQLLSGKLGCIDNINTDVYGRPIKITKNLSTPSLASFKGVGFKRKDGELTDEPNKSGMEVVKTYIGFLEAIQKLIGSDNISRDLWDHWVQLSAAKAFYQGTGKHIKLIRKDKEISIMPVYKDLKSTSNYAKRLNKQYDPEKTGDYGGSEISKDHLELPKFSSLMGKKSLKRIK